MGTVSQKQSTGESTREAPSRGQIAGLSYWRLRYWTTIRGRHPIRQTPRDPVAISPAPPGRSSLEKVPRADAIMRRLS
jgi:hypothetical protein